MFTYLASILFGALGLELGEGAEKQESWLEMDMGTGGEEQHQ